MARYHVNRLGRFSSPDLLPGATIDPQSLNRYSYVKDDPIDFTDPSGQLCVQWTNYTWVGGGDSGPGSWQISSVETDCFADPRMPGDDGGRGGGGGLDPDLSKKFIAKIKCNLGSQQVIQALEANFSSFANYSSADNKSYTVFTPGPISGGERLGIDSTVSIPFIPRVFTLRYPRRRRYFGRTRWLYVSNGWKRTTSSLPWGDFLRCDRFWERTDQLHD